MTQLRSPNSDPSDASHHERFAHLVAENLDFIWRMLRRYGVPDDEVDDAAQQVFLVADRKLDSVRAGSERPFLLAVTARVASHVRRSNQRRRDASERFLEQRGKPELQKEPLADQLVARELLEQIMDAMPIDVRAVFVLFELEGLSVDQIAEHLELPRGTVATRLRRARTIFREGTAALRTDSAGVSR